MSTASSLSLFLVLTVLVSCAFSAKILGIFPIASISHQIVFQPIWRELSLRGHQVTVLTPNPLKDSSLTNLTEIDLSFKYDKMEGLKSVLSAGMDHWLMMKVWTAFIHKSSQHFQHDRVQNFIKNNNETYDVILAEIIDPTSYVFAAKYNCPLIGVVSLSVTNLGHETVGNPVHPTLHPDLLTPYYGGDLSLFEKIDAVLFELYHKYLYSYKYSPLVSSIAKQYFGIENFDFENIQKNISMLFLNTNPIIHGVRPYGPNVIEFGGGIHLKSPKPLPNELKSYLDDASEGVIYFSLGSNVKSIYLPEDKRNTLIRTFAKLPYKVLWKFEDDQLEGKPENVKINKWLPQQDVLRHPNIKLFITQAGLQSTEEALLNGVPLIAIPFIGDQGFNARSIEKLGVGLRLDFQTLTEDKFHSSILEVIKNPKYKKKAVEIGRLLTDQPMTGLEKVVWWTEYVIRNQGAQYLRNPRADVSWTEFLILDVVAFLLFSLILVLFILYKVYQFFIGLVSKNLSLNKQSDLKKTD